MSGLFGSLSIALGSIFAQQSAIETTTENISNINTPGYSRKRAVLEAEPPLQYGSLLLGRGVTVSQIQSVRDRILELRINQETQHQGQLDAFLKPAQQVDALFSLTNGSGLDTALNNFFNSFNQLSASPTDVVARQNVIVAAQNLASTFRATAAKLNDVQNTLDQGVVQTVASINDLASRIAKLNSQIATTQSMSHDAGSLDDQRNQLIQQLSGLVGVAATDAGNGELTLTTVTGAPLVVGDSSYALAVQTDASSGHKRVVAQDRDITDALQGGQLSGIIAARDQFIPSVQSQLDDLAANLIQKINTVHQAGFDLSGNAGGNLFVPFVPAGSTSNSGAAAAFSVALTKPNEIAASSDGTPGDNANAKALAAIQTQVIANNQTPSQLYSGIVSYVGAQVAGATAELHAGQFALTQLQQQQSSVSGVSLDEEAANLIRYQRAFEAAARVVNVVDELTRTAINLGLGTAA